MKKVAIISTIFSVLIAFFTLSSMTYAAENSILPNDVESQLIEIKQDGEKSLEDYKQQYGSDTYGFVAFILNIIRTYSIPLCFLGIAIGAIHQYIIGIQKLDTQEKGLGLIVTFITVLIICQILPLAFAIIVKFGRG